MQDERNRYTISCENSNSVARIRQLALNSFTVSRSLSLCSLVLLIAESFYIVERLMVWLRDGRTLIGILRSIDQFANLVLHRTVERIHVGSKYGDLPVGVTIIRGENVILLGEIVRIEWVNSPVKILQFLIFTWKFYSTVGSVQRNDATIDRSICD